MTSSLEIGGLTAGYTAAPVLRDANLEVTAGEVVGVLGANGAGKTTLLRAISGTLPKCRGDIRLDGRSIAKLSPWERVRRGIAHVPEGRHVFGAMTVRDNLDVAALARRPHVPRSVVYDLFPRLRERAAQPAGRLSGGEQQMLAIGRALMTGPAVLAVDEMSAGLAPVLVEQLVDGLTRLKERGVALLIVEQSPHLVAHVVDRVYLLEQGVVVGAGSLAELGGPDRLAELYLGV